MANENNRWALIVVRLLGAPVVVFGGFLIHMSIVIGMGFAPASGDSIWMWLLTLMFAGVWLVLGGLLVRFACQLALRPTARALSWAAWAAAFMLAVLFHSVLVWFGLSSAPDFGTGWFEGALAVAVIVCMIGYWKLGKASGLIDAERRWWCQKTIRSLCTGIVLLMLVMWKPVFDVAASWGLVDDQHGGMAVVFMVWLPLMAIVERCGPRLLMWVSGVRPEAPTDAQPDVQPPPLTSGNGACLK